MLEKRERKMKLRGTVTREREEALGKRISTATPIQHEMWLISLETLLALYVVFEREAREFQSFHFFMFQLYRSNYRNLTRITHT